MCYIDCDEYAEIWQESVIVARKDHQCDCCLGTIRAGAAYTKHFSLQDSQVFAEKMCGPCSLAVEAFWHDHGTRFCPSQMWEALENCIAEGDEDSKRWLFAILGMKRRANARLTKESLAWRPRLPQRRRRAEVPHASA
jgi:hypothetical protein